jgi:hypothetical protein
MSINLFKDVAKGAIENDEVHNVLVAMLFLGMMLGLIIGVSIMVLVLSFTT